MSVIWLLLTCNQPKNSSVNDEVKLIHADSANFLDKKNDEIISEEPGPDTSNFADYYVLVIDTNINYEPLQQQMYELKRKFGLSVDTMDRYFSKTKNKIVLPDKYDDEIYAGEYYPRNVLSDFLSIEYMVVYMSDTRNFNMGLIGGIFEQKSEADKQLNLIKTREKKAFVFKSKIYIGCMH